MWPNLFGPGWLWGVLCSVGILGAVIGFVAALPGRGPRENIPDQVMNLWHRYETGDLTRREFERLMAAHRACMPTGGRVVDEGAKVPVRVAAIVPGVHEDAQRADLGGVWRAACLHAEFETPCDVRHAESSGL